MSRDLRELLADTATGPTREVDLDALAAGARRRRRVRRAGVAGGIAAVLVAVVAWPGATPLGIRIEDRVADQPEDAAAPLDLPGGWRVVEVGDAVFGVPPEMVPVTVGREEPVPCVNSVGEPTAFLAASGYPRGDQACNLLLSPVPTVLAAPLGTVPSHELDPGEGPWEVTPPGGPLDDLDPTVEARVDAREPLLRRAYRFPELDLYLSFSGEDTHDRAILATVTARGAGAR